LVSGAAFAVDLGGTVTGTVELLQGDTVKDSKITSSGSLDRVRIDGSGEAADGAFGGYFRYSDGGFAGNAWWKPIDQFKLLIGSNGGDGFIGKEGVTGWMFQQTAYDTGVGFGAGNIWGGGYGGHTVYRNAFFEGGGDGGNAAYLFITPLDMLAINVILPVFNGGEVGDVFMKAVAQLDLKFDFGNIALTYVGGRGYKKESDRTLRYVDPVAPDPDKDGWKVDNPASPAGTTPSIVPDPDTGTPGKWVIDYDPGYDEPGSFFVYYGGSFDALSIDFGLGYHFNKNDGKDAQPISVGLGLKYSVDTFGVKFRAVASLAGADKSTAVLAEVMPYFKLGDNLTAFVSAGLALTMPDGADTVTGWHFNPYIQVGEEWGAKFLAGFQVQSNGEGKEPVINWGVPIAIIVSF
jgi:hypothetical protein